jgi:hypothetical protein
VPHLLYGDMTVVELSVLDTEMRCYIEENSSISIYIYIYIYIYIHILIMKLFFFYSKVVVNQKCGDARNCLICECSPKAED